MNASGDGRNRWRFVDARMLCLYLSVAMVYFAAGGARLARYGDLSAFVGFGCFDPTICFARDNASALPDRAIIFRSGGYDGQFYYYQAAEIAARIPIFARSEFFDASGSFTAHVDAPVFRRARIGYPLLVSAFAMGGPRVLIAGMILLPLALHLFAVALLARRLRAQLYDSERTTRRLVWPGLIVFALNPVSLFCFVYALADGLALDLTMLAVLCVLPASVFQNQATHLSHDFKRGDNRWREGFAYVVGGMLLALAVLTKEHALAGAAGLGLAGVFAFWRSRRSVAGDSIEFVRRARVRAFGWICVAGFAALALASWWWWIGFDPGLAAERGGWPFAGLAGYLFGGEVDAFFSGRTYLVGWLLVCVLIASGLVFFAGVASRIALGTLAASLALASFATADEYWGNFANILRLFTPAFGALLFAGAAASTRAVSAQDDADNRATNQWPRKLVRGGLWIGVLVTGALVFAILESEITGRLLPVFEFRRGVFEVFDFF